MDSKVAEFAQKLGARIVQLRKEQNFAQERLATLARMNKGYLSSVESGQRVPSVGMLARLSKVLQVHIFDLFVFPDRSPMERLWEEVRHGSSPAASQLRSQFGLATAALKASKPKAAKAGAKVKPAVKVIARPRVTTTSKQSPRAAAPNRGAKRRR